jgi:hypothetical protein
MSANKQEVEVKSESISDPQLRHLRKILEALGGKRTEWQFISESGVLPDLYEAQRRFSSLNRLEVREALGLPRYPEPRVFTVKTRVLSSKTLAELLVATECSVVGVDSNSIPEHERRLWQDHDEEISVFHFGKGFTFTEDQILAELNSYGYRPVLVEELLSLAVERPNLQRKFPIAGIGCKVPDGRWWMIDSPAIHAIQSFRPRRVGLFRNIPIYDFYRVAAVRDYSLPQSRPLAYTDVLSQEAFSDSEEEAMQSAYRRTATPAE